MFEISKTALSMAEKRGFTIETAEIGGDNYYSFVKNGNPAFVYKTDGDRLQVVSVKSETDMVQAFPDYIDSDEQIRDFIKNWPINPGESEDV